MTAFRVDHNLTALFLVVAGNHDAQIDARLGQNGRKFDASVALVGIDKVLFIFALFDFGIGL